MWPSSRAPSRANCATPAKSRDIYADTTTDAMMRPRGFQGGSRTEYGRFAMRRFTVPFFVGAVLLMSAIGVSVRPSVFAQEATPTGMATIATHPVVGTWEMTGA